MNPSFTTFFNDSDIIDLELRCSGQSDVFLDDLDFILDDEGVTDGGDDVGILDNSRRLSKSRELVAMDIQEFDAWKNAHFDEYDTVNMIHASRPYQVDMLNEVEVAPLDQRQTLCEDDAPCPCFRPKALDEHAQFEAEYNEALQSLADSMQRTEVTRRQVMLQRQILMPMQQQQTQQVQQQVFPPPPSPQQHQDRSISPGRSSILNAFFSGSRCTLTNGLEQSRKQLNMYMTQMNQQTF